MLREMKNISAIALFVLAVLLLSIPIIVVMNQRQQSNNSHAAEVTNPLAGLNLKFPAQQEQYNTVANQWQATRASDAALLRTVGAQQKAVWLAEDWAPATTIASTVDRTLNQAATMGATPVFVVYSIPKRDCASYSGGGSTSMAAYKNWVQQYANGINHRRAIVIVEPDALMMFDCLSAQEQTDRLSMLQFAVTTFKTQGANVYIDGGNARWIPATTVAQRLNQAGIANADGFAVNVSNFYTTTETTTYGNQISTQTAGKHFVIDTSRNGLGSYTYPPTGQSQWCNPPGRALGLPATTETGNSIIDAFLWIKTPGQSDGQCTEFGQNDPSAGTFMPEYALGLAKRATWLQPQLTATPSPTTTITTPTAILTATPTLPTATSKPTATPVPTNLLLNSSFENGLTSWNFYVQSPAAAKATQTTSTKADGQIAIKIVVTKTSTQPFHVQLMQNNIPLIAGKTYTLKFWAKASKGLTTQTIIQQAGGAWTIHSSQNSALTTAWKQYLYTFQAPTNSTDQLAFNMAKTAATIWIDGVSLISN